jgi:hypothetical protein
MTEDVALSQRSGMEIVERYSADVMFEITLLSGPFAAPVVTNR